MEIKNQNDTSRNFRKLRLLVHLGIIDLNDFYWAEAFSGGINLQGQLSKNKKSKYSKINGLIESFDYENCQLEINGRGIRITLTTPH